MELQWQLRLRVKVLRSTVRLASETAKPHSRTSPAKTPHHIGREWNGGGAGRTAWDRNIQSTASLARSPWDNGVGGYYPVIYIYIYMMLYGDDYNKSL